MSSLEVVVGAQYGSEAKGHVVQRLTERQVTQRQEEDFMCHVVRVAGPNAGHTGYDRDGKSWALRQVPVAAVVPDDRVMLGIAAGSEIDSPVLLDELTRLKDTGVLGGKQVWISGAATLISEKDYTAERGLVGKIGSTGKGIGSARSNRLMRKAKTVKDDPALVEALTTLNVAVMTETASSPRRIMRDQDHLIIEGTQGYGLGLHTKNYPQVTSSDCRACDFMAMAGIHAWEFAQIAVWAVARMYPIRVAGNSGPMKDETSWEELSLPEELTTVTKKVRRVGMPDWNLVREAVTANGGAPTVRLALTMVDQMFPAMKDRRWTDVLDDDESNSVARQKEDAEHYLLGIQARVGARIGLITTGPNTATFTKEN